MKTDIQQLMEKAGLDAIWVVGNATHNPPMTYFTGAVHVSNADLILIRGKDPVLFVNSMEREEGASTGLETINKSKYEIMKLLEESGGDFLLAGAKMAKMIFEELGLTEGKVSVYGKVEAGSVLGVVKHLEKLLPGIEFIGEGGRSLLLEARATKDDGEIERIRKMGKVTTEVVGKTAAYLQSRQVNEDQILLNDENEPLTIGEMHTKINHWLAEKGVENPLGCIFAQGRDAGIPHSAGTHEDPIYLGKTIIFDIYPREPGGGYFYDFTRTWCLGYAPDEEQKIYDDVKFVYEKIMEELTIDEITFKFQERTCELFEERGHKTIRQDSQLQSGYVHNVGHGLGLDVHERPWFGKFDQDNLSAGSVVTIEPGLYYPDQGMGCRLEDSVWVRPDGKMEVLADYPYDLVLPMENWNG